MPKPNYIELDNGDEIPILYEDRSVIAIDKPAGWLLAPDSWTQTSRSLQTALRKGIASRDYWAKSRNLKFLRFVHRLDAETTGIVLCAKSPGAIGSLSRLFEGRKVEKVYLAVVQGVPKQRTWACRLKLAPNPEAPGLMKVDTRSGKDSETEFRVLKTARDNALLEVRPLTGRTHQIRVHLAESSHPVLGDTLYGPSQKHKDTDLALRAICLSYTDPFTRRPVTIQAPTTDFLKQFGFA